MDEKTTVLLSYLHRGGKWTNLWTKQNKQTEWYKPGENSLNVADYQDMDTYFSVHPCYEKPPQSNGTHYIRTQVKYIAAINCVYGDFDVKDFSGSWKKLDVYIAGLPIPPSAQVKTGGGYHLYWLLSNTFLIKTSIDRSFARGIQKDWVRLIKSDPGAKDLARVLRLPGTLNHKYTPPLPIEFVTCNLELTYPLEEIEALTQDIRTKREKRSVSVGAGKLKKDVKWAAEQLEKLPSEYYDDRDKWIAVGMALSSLGAPGLQAWVDFSKKSTKYAVGICREKWVGFDPDGEIQLGSLFHWAQGFDSQEGVDSIASEDTSKKLRYSLADAFEPRKPIQWLVQGLLTIPSLSAAYGDPDSLKSMLMLYVGLCVASGRPLLEGTKDERAVAQGTVVWLDYDTGKRKTLMRIEALSRAMHLPMNTPFYFYSMDPPFDAYDEASVARMIEILHKDNPRFIVIDCLRTVSGDADENSAEMRHCMHSFRRMSEEFNAALTVIHHPTKSDSSVICGSGAIEAALDLALFIRRRKDSTTITVKSTKNRDAPIKGFITKFFCTQKMSDDVLETNLELKTAWFGGLPERVPTKGDTQVITAMNVLYMDKDQIASKGITDAVKYIVSKADGVTKSIARKAIDDAERDGIIRLDSQGRSKKVIVYL